MKYTSKVRRESRKCVTDSQPYVDFSFNTNGGNIENLILSCLER